MLQPFKIDLIRRAKPGDQILVSDTRAVDSIRNQIKKNHGIVNIEKVLLVKNSNMDSHKSYLITVEKPAKATKTQKDLE